MKVVINKCYGGFGLSPEAVIELAKMGSSVIKKIPLAEYFGKSKDLKKEIKHWKKRQDGYLQSPSLSATIYDPKEEVILSDADIRAKENRTNKDVIAVVEKLGAKADGYFAELKIIEIPDGIEWEVGEYDGIEWIDEKHRSWG